MNILGTKTVKKEMDKIDNKRGCVTRHVGHMNPLMMNPTQINATAPIQNRLIRHQFGCGCISD